MWVHLSRTSTWLKHRSWISRELSRNDGKKSGPKYLHNPKRLKQKTFTELLVLLKRFYKLLDRTGTSFFQTLRFSDNSCLFVHLKFCLINCKSWRSFSFNDRIQKTWKIKEAKAAVRCVLIKQTSVSSWRTLQLLQSKHDEKRGKKIIVTVYFWCLCSNTNNLELLGVLTQTVDIWSYFWPADKINCLLWKQTDPVSSQLWRQTALIQTAEGSWSTDKCWRR